MLKENGLIIKLTWTAHFLMLLDLLQFWSYKMELVNSTGIDLNSVTGRKVNTKLSPKHNYQLSFLNSKT